MKSTLGQIQTVAIFKWPVLPVVYRNTILALIFMENEHTSAQKHSFDGVKMQRWPSVTCSDRQILPLLHCSALQRKQNILLLLYRGEQFSPGAKPAPALIALSL